MPRKGVPRMRTDIDRPLVEGLAARLRIGLAKLVRPAEAVALLDFPNHDNIGDSAIWLGELAWLRDAGHELAYASDHTGFSAAELRRRLPRGTILLHGGGNFGDLWPVYQRFREHVLAVFPYHRIVQLPQTVHFHDPRAVQRTARVIAAHPDVTVCVRDHASQRITRERLGARAELLPDMALALGPLEPGPIRHEVLCLLREDQERVVGRRAPAGVQLDWPRQRRRSLALRQTTRLVGKLGSLARPVAHVTAPALAAGYRQLAHERLEAGLEVVGAGSLLVTDRLHGHILGLLAGVPQLLLDNSYGKLRGFWQVWTRDAATTRIDGPAPGAPRVPRP
jgi:exopolysaccharide biosynthesis predicted pyruvyltransferase EpsI